MMEIDMKHLWILLLLVLGLFSCQNESQEIAKPNIIIIISDDHTQQAISAYGSKLTQTPNIDRIANEGVLFNKAYVNNSICGPSRAALLTGKYSHKNGYRDNENSFYDSSQEQFVNHLQKAGYQTAWIGKYHLGEDPKGFDYWEILPGQGHYYNPDFIQMDGSIIRKEGYVSNLIEDAAESWLDSRDQNKPFCLILGHKATHRTWMPDLDDLDMFDDVEFPIPDNFYDDYKNREAARVQDMSIAHTMQMAYDLKMYPEDTKDGNVTRMTADQRKIFDAYYNPIYKALNEAGLEGDALTEWKFQRYMRDYLATAASMDRNIGRLLDYLDNHALSENTIVIYLSDQGFYLGEHGWFDKRFMYEESFRTPMMMRYPGVIAPGTVSEDFVINLDIGPTMLQAAGLEIPKDMDGKSFLPVLTDPKAEGREAVYYHYYENGEHAVSPHFGVRTDRYKLIRFYKRVEEWELYDLGNDPQEHNNLFGNEEYAEVHKEMYAKLMRVIEKYGDEEANAIVEQPMNGDLHLRKK
ncbi:arylsulfatase A family protein [Belliella baltica DSM 15883]|uniref:Arylsulfatase A family protein n=1 Tax=Belliella baltica (strain DSM 15883 / CIP 108006 / LMG 21964 / BA134) TaxID=866536 RepID=I3Z925_BELBD|nr:sulfatase [Belliella baltica]AFL85743.1 arylsulfatase A family protein [Belliella baltica DSM 15883]